MYINIWFKMLTLCLSTFSPTIYEQMYLETSFKCEQDY